jgi:hypothetical protein
VIVGDARGVLTLPRTDSGAAPQIIAGTLSPRWPSFNYRAVSFPYWIPVTIFALAPLISTVGFWRRRRLRSLRRLQGLCPQCGYDLRATLEARCPECGADRPA